MTSTQPDKTDHLVYDLILKIVKKVEKLIDKYPQFEEYINKNSDVEEPIREFILTMKDGREKWFEEILNDADYKDFKGFLEEYHIPYWVLKLLYHPAYLIACAVLRKFVKDSIAQAQNQEPSPEDFKELYE